MCPVPKTKSAKQIGLSSRPISPRERAGRDEMSRICAVQLVRMLTAAAQVVAEGGYGGMSVARVAGRAGVSRRTFYDLFEDREDCFLAVFDDGVVRAGKAASSAYKQAQDGWREQVRAALAALLDFFDDEPQLASLLVVDALGAGPRVHERRAQVLQRLAWIVEEGRSVSRAPGARKGSHRTPSLTAEGAVGAVLSVIHARLLYPGPGPTPRLTPLLNDLMGMLVLPYLGLTAAEEELKHDTPKTAPARRKLATDPLDALPMRLTYRTLRVLAAIAEQDTEGARPSNRQIGELAGVPDQGQISKLLARLQNLDLIRNTGNGHQPTGERNAWTLTRLGRQVTRRLRVSYQSEAT